MTRPEKLDLILKKLIEKKDTDKPNLSIKGVVKLVFNDSIDEDEAISLVREIINEGNLVKRLVGRRDGPTLTISAIFETEQFLNKGGFTKLYQKKEDQQIVEQNRMDKQDELTDWQLRLTRMEVKLKRYWWLPIVISVLLSGIVSYVVAKLTG